MSKLADIAKTTKEIYEITSGLPFEVLTAFTEAIPILAIAGFALSIISSILKMFGPSDLEIILKAI